MKKEKEKKEGKGKIFWREYKCRRKLSTFHSSATVITHSHSALVGSVRATVGHGYSQLSAPDFLGNSKQQTFEVMENRGGVCEKEWSRVKSLLVQLAYALRSMYAQHT
jgi:hypothetical protein